MAKESGGGGSAASAAASSSAAHDKRYHVGYLYSSPLVGTLGPRGPFVIDGLDIEREKQRLCKALGECKKAITVRMEAATTHNLVRMLAHGCRALHYTGHGFQQCLAFEDGKGMMHSLTAAQLKELFTAGGNAQGVQFVFVSACHSETAAAAFVDAGVPHVIAVKLDAKVSDTAAHIFMDHFYFSLFMGKTVYESFTTAKTLLKNCAEVPQIDQANKFLLLPKGEKLHNVKVFESIAEGQWHNLSEADSPNNIDSLPEHFLGRNFDIQKAVHDLADRNKRLVVLTGERGIGRSTVARAAAHYLAKRRHFGAVCMVHFASYDKTKHHSVLSYVVPELLRKEFFTEEQSSKITNKDELFFALKDKSLLLLLLGVDKFLHEPVGSAHCLRSFVNELMSRCAHVKVLLTCVKKFGGFKGALEHETRVGPLSPLDAARLFSQLTPRQLVLQEFGCPPNESDRALLYLSQHEALQLLGGNPARLFHYVQYLSKDVMVSHLPDLIRAEERKRFESALTKQVKEEHGRELWRSFGQKYEVPWSVFADKLCAHFVTRCQVAERGLDDKDVAVMRRKLGVDSKDDAAPVLLDNFAKFWPWFHALQSVITSLRPYWLSSRQHQHPNQPLLVHGLRTRDEAAALLQDARPGTFVVRLTENYIGAVAVSFLDDRGALQNLLLQLQKIGVFCFVMEKGAPAAPGSFIDVIHSCERLRWFHPELEKTEVVSIPEPLMMRQISAEKPNPHTAAAHSAAAPAASAVPASASIAAAPSASAAMVQAPHITLARDNSAKSPEHSVSAAGSAAPNGRTPPASPPSSNHSSSSFHPIVPGGVTGSGAGGGPSSAASSGSGSGSGGSGHLSSPNHHNTGSVQQPLTPLAASALLIQHQNQQQSGSSQGPAHAPPPSNTPPLPVGGSGTTPPTSQRNGSSADLSSNPALVQPQPRLTAAATAAASLGLSAASGAAAPPAHSRNPSSGSGGGGNSPAARPARIMLPPNPLVPVGQQPPSSAQYSPQFSPIANGTAVTAGAGASTPPITPPAPSAASADDSVPQHKTQAPAVEPFPGRAAAGGAAAAASGSSRGAGYSTPTGGAGDLGSLHSATATVNTGAAVSAGGGGGGGDDEMPS